MLEYDFEESITYWVCMTSRALEHALNEELAPHGITYRQWQVLGWLALEGDLSQSQLAERLRVEASSLVGLLDRMEKAGWIRRHPSPTDRRKNLIQPTHRVKPVWAKIAESGRKVRTRASQGLSRQEMSTLHDLMKRVQQNLNFGQEKGNS